MSIFSRIKHAFTNWLNKRYLQKELAKYVADSHHEAVMATVRREFPELAGEMIPSTLVGLIVRRANKRLLEHIM